MVKIGSKVTENSSSMMIKMTLSFATFFIGLNYVFVVLSMNFRTCIFCSTLHSKVDYNVDDACLALPTIRPSGTYFLDPEIKEGPSPEIMSPAFKVGSYLGAKVTNHMKDDWTTFQLIKSALIGEEGGLTFDFGANQGFFTYFLATIGMQVHSFEINEMNFRALQHGAEFNPKEVVERVHLYPVGMGKRNARFSMKGFDYSGFIHEGQGGPILGVTFDCFAHHMNGELDISETKLVKLDVEGFEMAVLRGMQNSLFAPGTKNVKAMVMEVGPDRWKRASIDLNGGIEDMRNLSRHFKKSFVLIRGDRQCPTSLTEGVLSDNTPDALEQKNSGEVMKFAVKMDEWAPLLTRMEKNRLDCNFWYENY